MMAETMRLETVADLRDRRVVVLGLARSGIAACRFLADAGASVTAYDRRSRGDLSDAIGALGGRPVRLALGIDPEEARALLADADLLVTSPSVSPRFPTTDPWLREALVAAMGRGAEVVSEVGLFLRLTRARLVGVTGTKGKTTTASLVAAMLERAAVPVTLGGNIGTPLIERVEALGPDDWVVLELSELQLPTIDRGVDVALYTNIGEDHLDRHGSVAAYRAVKARLAELSVSHGRVVLNADDPGCRDLGDRLAVDRVSWYGVEADGARALDAALEEAWITVAGERLLPADEVPLPGRHMLADVVGAALGARLVGADAATIAAAIRDFPGVPHRLETVAVRDGVRWVNDSQATIPDAAIAGLAAFDVPVVLIAGGKDKGLDYRAFADQIVSRARACVLIGETAAALERLLAGRVPVRRASSMAEAVRAAASLASAGDVALLSPAAASFDMFADYAERGDAFRAAVSGLGGEA
jgi:UDP-N-acetylmuramoylalanine--D-glutamate ligase